MIEEGKYLGKITMAGFGQSEQKGTDFLEVEFRLKDSGEEISWRGYFTEKTVEFRKKDLDTMGFKGTLKDFDNFTEKLLDTEKEYELAVSVEGNENKSWNVIQYINTPKEKLQSTGNLSNRLKSMGLILSSEKKGNDQSGQNVTKTKWSSDSKSKTDPRNEDSPF
jgi:hypothetical protein